EVLPASVYKQGEAARAQGQLDAAIGHFNRVASVAPQSAVRPNAQYDAAAAMLAKKDWDGAARTLEDFRSRYPKSPLQEEVSAKLAVAYSEKGSWALAAGEFETLAAANKDPQRARAGRRARRGVPMGLMARHTRRRANPRSKRAGGWHGWHASRVTPRVNSC